MKKKLHNLLKFFILAIEKTVKIIKTVIYNFAMNYAKFIETFIKFSKDLVNNVKNIPNRGGFPKFSNIEIIAQTMTAESESIDSENRLFDMLKARKRVETNFTQLTGQYMFKRNYAKLTDGLFARIIGKISAQTIVQYFNFINIPIDRVKYALI